MNISYAVTVKVPVDTGRLNDNAEYDLQKRHFQFIKSEKKYEAVYRKNYSISNLNDLQKDIEFLVKNQVQSIVEIHAN